MIISKNPYNNEILHSFNELSTKEIEKRVEAANSAFHKWKNISFVERSELMQNVAKVLEDNKENFGKTISLEMGKPIRQSVAEIAKCSWVCKFYAENAQNFLSPEIIESDAYKSYVNFEPLGVVLAVMRWKDRKSVV